MIPKLYQYDVCPFCHKVKAMLELKGALYERIEVHPLKKKEIAFSTDYRAVPIYIDGEGLQVNDSTPIMRHIDREFPEFPVFESEPSRAEEEEKWLSWSEKYVKGLPAYIYRNLGASLRSFNYITKIDKFNAFEKVTVKYSGAFVMTLVSKKIRKRLQIDDPEAFLKQCVDEWVAGLNEREFMGGEKPNGADVAVFGISRSVAELDAGDIFAQKEAFKAWYERMKVYIARKPVTQA